MVRLQVVFDSAEGRALTELAVNELRDPRDQIRLIVRRELERRGLLPPSDQPARAQGEQFTTEAQQ